MQNVWRGKGATAYHKHDREPNGNLHAHRGAALRWLHRHEARFDLHRRSGSRGRVSVVRHDELCECSYVPQTQLSALAWHVTEFNLRSIKNV